MPNSSGGRAPAANAPDLSPEAFVYIEKVRQTTSRLGAEETAPEDLGGAVQAVRNVSTFDVEVPVASRRRELELVKTGVKRLSVWYMRYLAEQLNAFGKSVSDLGDALAKRTDALASVSDDLAVRLGAVETFGEGDNRPQDCTCGREAGAGARNWSPHHAQSVPGEDRTVKVASTVRMVDK
jgi:hypothetical protein